MLTSHIQFSLYPAYTRAVAATFICQTQRRCEHVVWFATITTSRARQGLVALLAATTPSTHSLTSAPWQAARGGHWPPPASCLQEIPSSSVSGLLGMASLTGQRPELPSAETSGGYTWIGMTLRFSSQKNPRLNYAIIFNHNSSMK